MLDRVDDQRRDRTLLVLALVVAGLGLVRLAGGSADERAASGDLDASCVRGVGGVAMEPEHVWPDAPLPRIETIDDALALLGVRDLPIPRDLARATVRVERDPDDGGVVAWVGTRAPGRYEDVEPVVDAVLAAVEAEPDFQAGDRSEGTFAGIRFHDQEVRFVGGGDSVEIEVHECDDRGLIQTSLFVRLGPEQLGDCAARATLCRPLYASEPDVYDPATSPQPHPRAEAVGDRMQLTVEGILPGSGVDRERVEWSEERQLEALIDDGWELATDPCYLDIGFATTMGDCAPPDPLAPRSHQLRRTFESGVTVVYDVTYRVTEVDDDDELHVTAVLSTAG